MNWNQFMRYLAKHLRHKFEHIDYTVLFVEVSRKVNRLLIVDQHALVLQVANYAQF